MSLVRGTVVEKAIDDHPAIVVQVDDATLALATVLVVPLTDAKQWGGSRKWVHFCDRSRNEFLTKDSVAVIPWVEAVEKKMLVKKTVAGQLHPDDLVHVSAKLRSILGLF